MSWKEWTAVTLVIGAGVLWQIPGHDEMEMDNAGRHDEMSMESAEVEGPYRTVARNVTGMT